VNSRYTRPDILKIVISPWFFYYIETGGSGTDNPGAGQVITVISVIVVFTTVVHSYTPNPDKNLPAKTSNNGTLEEPAEGSGPRLDPEG
jgi:hypothetical protein